MATPLPICFLNGEYLPLEQARISPLDRGFLFADSVYEVLPVFAGRMFRFKQHFDRLARSLGEIRLASPHSHEEWSDILQELVRRNGSGDMYLYVQVTRGAELGRNHAFPAHVRPTVFALAAPLPSMSEQERTRGLSAITIEDFRWGRCDIKTTALLANVLMKQQAVEAGAQEAIIVRNGHVLEGASTSIFVLMDDALVTPPDSPGILPGTTRDVVIDLAKDLVPVQARRLSVDELRAAKEVWLCAATRDVLPVTRIDAQPVGDGLPGPVWRKVSAAFDDYRAL